MKHLPLFGSGVSSYSAVVTRQRRLNVLLDVRSDQDRSAVVAVGTPGTLTWTTVPAAPVWGWHQVGTSLYVVAGKQLYSVNSAGAVSVIGALPTVSRFVSMVDNALQLLIVDGVAGYIYSITGHTISTITDTNFPNGCTSVGFLDGYFFAVVPGVSGAFNQSVYQDGTNWTEPGTSSPIIGYKENSSDPLLALNVVNGTMMLYGSTSTELWQDVAGAPLLVQRINGATQPWGLAAVNSLAVLAGGSTVFLGFNPDGGVRVVQLVGTGLAPISTSDVDYTIKHFSVVADAVALVYSAYGHSVYQLTFPTAGRTLCYDLASGLWHEAQTGLGVTAPHFATLGVAFAGKNLLCDATTGHIYYTDENAYSDNGAPIPREVCTRHIRADGNRLYLSQLMLDMETGVGNSAAPAPHVFVSVSRDGGHTFGPERFKLLGSVGQYIQRVVFNRLGSARDFVVRIRMADAVKFILTSAGAAIEQIDS